MDSYITKVQGGSFMDLKDDPEFQKDLVRFFSGGRYNYSKEDMREMGIDSLTKEFVEHMRSQAWNEVTAVKDLNYVRNKDMDQRGKDAFGRLIQAWDSSEDVGGTYLDGIGDFGEAILTAPSTYVGLTSFGVGKAAAKAGTYATQLAVRAGVKRATVKELGKRAVNRSVAKETLKGAALGAAEATAVGGIQSYGAGETREEVIQGYEYTSADLAYDTLTGAATAGVIGGGVGGLSGFLGSRRANNVDKILEERKGVFKQQAEEAAKRSLDTLNRSTGAKKKAALNIVSDLDEILSARSGNKKSKLKDPLDPERVAKGKAILGSMSDPKSDVVFSHGLSTSTLRGIAAAAVEMQERLGITPGPDGKVRITQFVADAMQSEGSEQVFATLDFVRKKYGLNKDEFSLIYLSEVSRAGQTLGFASAISRKGKIKPGASDIDILFAKGASSINGQDAKEIAASAVRNATKSAGEKTYGFFQDMDSLRTSFMTSQPQTTIRNVLSTGILMGADISDEAFKALFKGITGDTAAIKNFIPNATAILRGMTINKAEAQLLKQVMLDELPETSKRLYSEAMRLELGMESNSVLAKVGRAANFANTLTDTALKETIFYGSLDRQFRENGSSLTEWLKSNKKFDDLPEGISVDQAVKDANSMTMQDTFRDSNSLVGNTTKALVRLNRKIPFLVSVGLGMPFPRYTGNHIQKMSEYAPLFGELTHQLGITQGPQDAATRAARQATGALMLWGGYELADARQGEVDYGSIKNTIIQEIGEDADLKPLLGATMAHMYVGDLLWRSNNGLPLPKGEQLLREVQDVLGGIPDFSFDLGMAIEPIVAISKGESGSQAAADEFMRKLGDFAATYTMNPAVVLTRDVIGQVSYDQAGAPYTRDIAEQEEPSMKGEKVSFTEAGNRAARFLPDFLFRQYNQSFNGETDIPYYDPFNPVARGKINPALKQITGITSEPAKTEIEMEMSKYGIQSYEIYSNSTEKNALVDVILRAKLAKTLHKEFVDWRSSGPASLKYGQMTYDEIVNDPNIDTADKAAILESYIKSRITERQKQVTQVFESMLANDPYSARGFLRNNYYLYARSEGGSRNLDTAAQMINQTSAEEYLSEAETTQDEVERRMKLLLAVPNLKPAGVY